MLRFLLPLHRFLDHYSILPFQNSPDKMSTPPEKKAVAGKQADVDSLADRLQRCSTDKPDSKKVDLGSPVSPLGSRRNVGAIPTTSTSSSSSGSFTGRNVADPSLARSGSCGSRQSCEPSVSSPIAGGHTRHRASSSRANAGVGSSASSAPVKDVFPVGNICPSGRVVTSVSSSRRSSPKSDVMGSGRKVNYGHGSIVRGCSGGSGGAVAEKSVRAPPPCKAATEAEELKNAGNVKYNRGEFLEAIGLYDQAIDLWKENAACRSNKAAALIGLGRLPEAVMECQAAVKIDRTYARAHQRLSYLFLRLGHIELAREHMFIAERQPEKTQLEKMNSAERHMLRVSTYRERCDWKSTLQEVDAAIAAGVDSSPQLFACRAEAFLNSHRFKDAESCLGTFREYELRIPTCSNADFFGMLCDAYPLLVRAEIEAALGRFEEAAGSIGEAWQIDARNVEISILHRKVGSTLKAWAGANRLFKAGNFEGACFSYGRCLKQCPGNYSLFCDMAACRYNMGMWDKAISKCNHALAIHPGATRALSLRAGSYSKLERWDQAVGDYETLLNELPGDREVEESLLQARAASRISHGEELQGMRLGREVESVVDLGRFRTATSSPGVAVVLFGMESEALCREIGSFFETLCGRYPSTDFLKVDVKQGGGIALAEGIRDVPTVRVYARGARVEEITCPTRQMLESCVGNYGK